MVASEKIDGIFVTNSRDRIVEVNKYGSTMKASLQRTKVGNGGLNGESATEYVFYLSDSVKEGTLHFKYGADVYSVEFVNHNLAGIGVDGSVTESMNDSIVSISSDVQNITADYLTSQLSHFASVSAPNPNSAPSVDNPYTITYSNLSDVTPLSIVYPQSIVEETRSLNDDFILEDDELASLPEQLDLNDLSAVITIRAKAQNTWNKV